MTVLRLSLCNEVLRDRPFAEQCRLASELGCTGLELAPFTLATDPFDLTEADGSRLRAQAAGYGLAISSLHWLLAAPPGLSIATPDAARRTRALELMQRLVDVAAACDAPVLVHGSPAQRAPDPGQPLADAVARCMDAWAQAGRWAEARGVTYCIEPLSPAETRVVNRLHDAAAIVRRIGSPALRTMFDLSAASAGESEPPQEALRRYLDVIAHVQLNDANRRGPGQGGTPVAPVLRVLRDGGYGGWIALEPFDYHPEPLACAAASAAYVRGAWEALAS